MCVCVCVCVCVVQVFIWFGADATDIEKKLAVKATQVYSLTCYATIHVL